MIDMDKFFISIALVQKSVAGKTFWLLREQDELLRFIVGNRLEKESFRETVIREVAWQLNLDRRRDMLVSNMSQLSIEFDEQLPDSSGQRHVALAFYNVHLNRQKVIDVVDAENSNHWVTASEICLGRSDDGRQIDSEIVGWINKYEIVKPWQI